MWVLFWMVVAILLIFVALFIQTKVSFLSKPKRNFKPLKKALLTLGLIILGVIIAFAIVAYSFKDFMR